MSASAKKKLRKEQNAVQLTEKQLKEQKEAKKLKAYTGIFVAAIALILVAAIIAGVTNFFKSSGIVEKKTVAAVIDDYEMNSVELSYYYQDTITNNYNTWKATYGESLNLFMSFMGLDLTKPLNEQQYSEGVTWADYFVDAALEKAKSDYKLYNKAIAEGFTMPEEDRLALDDSIAQMPLFASVYGYSDVDHYLRSMYGPGSTEATYIEYSEKVSLANAYYNAYGKGLEITADDISSYADGKYDQYASFSYASYRVPHSDYLTGGTTNEDGTTVYTAAEEEAARAAAKADAMKLTSATTVDELNAAIAALPKNKDTSATASTFTNSLYKSLSAVSKDWLASSLRKEGDCAVIPSETTITNEDGSTSTVENDFYVVMFLGRDNNERPLANVRHILVNFEGGTTDSNGNTTYTEVEKAVARVKAEDIMAEFLAGAADDASFAALATEKTDDTASAATGGLYEDITPEEGIYVEPFTNWAVDPARKAGDVEIIETVYGYHVMYYVGDDELTYRDYMVQEDIRSEAVAAWYKEVLGDVTAEKKDISRLNLDMILQA